MLKILLVLISFSTAHAISQRRHNYYQPLIKSKCTWSRARHGYEWRETQEEGCKFCKCMRKGDSLWQECKTAPRPTSWVKNCKVIRNRCKYNVVNTNQPTQPCMVFAYTTYNYQLWVADRGSSRR